MNSLKIPYDDRIHLAKYYFAHECFSQAADLCGFIIANRSQLDDMRYINLISTVFVAYGKPFKHSRGIGKFKKEQRENCGTLFVKIMQNVHGRLQILQIKNDSVKSL